VKGADFVSRSSAVGYTDSGGAVMDEIIYRPLDLNKLQNKKHTNISSEEALGDVVPIQWDDDVVSGKKKVLLVEKS